MWSGSFELDTPGDMFIKIRQAAYFCYRVCSFATWCQLCGLGDKWRLAALLDYLARRASMFVLSNLKRPLQTRLGMLCTLVRPC